ncbi:MAG: tetratricopeptide repeat protein [Patescibacteria group bacterium]
MEGKKTTHLWYLPVLLVLTAMFILIGLKFVKTGSEEKTSTPATQDSPASSDITTSDTQEAGLPADQTDYLNAGAFMEKGDYQNATKSLDAAIAKNPNNINYYSLKSQAELLAGNETAARSTLEAGLKVDPSNNLLNSKLDVLNNAENLAPAN